MTFYPAKETGGHFQNWAIEQDDRGVMYIGNGFGVQEFDGSTWRMILSPNQSSTRAFSKDQNGRIYVGSLANLGYLAPDDRGSMEYVSLMNYLKEDQSFNYIRTVHATPQGVYFQAQEILIRFQPDTTGTHEQWQVKVWRPTGNFSYTFWVDQTLYVQQVGIGLMKMVNDSLVLIPDSEQFSNDRIQIMLPFPGKSNTYLIGTYTRGLYIWDNHSFKPFHTDVDQLLLDGPLYYGVLTPDSCFALGSTSTGFFIIDETGKTRLRLSQETGFTSNTVTCLCVDRQKNIWVGMDGSIAVLEYSSPLSLFDVAPGSGANDFNRHKGIFYAATNDGVYYLDSVDSKFKHVSGVLGNAQAFYFSEINNELYIPTGVGIYRLTGTKATLALATNALSIAFNCLAKSRQDSTIVFGGMLNGLGLLRFDDKTPDRFTFLAQVPGVHEYISRNIIETEPGILWPSTLGVGAIRIQFENKNFANPIVKRFGTDQGLPAGSVSVFNVADRLLYVTKQGVYTFDEEQETFSPDPLFAGISLGRNPDENIIVADREGNIWAGLGKESVLLQKQPDGGYQLRKEELARFSDEPVTVMFAEENGVIWFGTANYAIRYAPSQLSMERTSFPALIRCVSFADDSIIYHGASVGIDELNNPAQRIFPFRLNSLRFEFAAPSFLNPRANEFSTRLEGFDENWSSWNVESRRTYTNLSPGKYRFCVRARNITNQESEDAVYAFTILNPWYTSWWAYCGYILLFGGLMFGLVRLRTKQLQERSRIWEKTVQERTAEIQEQKNNIEQLSRIGRDITSNLSVPDIIHTVYENVNRVMEASIFGIGLYSDEAKRLIFPATIEKGETQAEYSISLSDESSLAVFCFKHLQDIIINDHTIEYQNYSNFIKYSDTRANPVSILFLPLHHKDRTVGVITAQSFNKNAFSGFHLNVLRNLATYSAIALDNADAYRRLNELLHDLKITQDKLITQSKLAALGALTAGIAHEIKNPLNFVNNFAELSSGLLDEFRLELEKMGGKLTGEEIVVFQDIISTLQENAERIKEHGKRADSIVRSMLQHSRGKSGERQLTDINAMLAEDINLAYHGMRAQDSSFNIKIETELDADVGKLEVVPQDISRVFLNIITNACYEAHRKRQAVGGSFAPLLKVSSRSMKEGVEVRIRDNGNGVPEAIRDKLFNPFFTTKPAGQGTGLGLSISYDIIVHEHHGELIFESQEGEFAEFIIKLPR